MKTDNDLIWDYLPSDHSRQSSSLDEAEQILARLSGPTVLDLGCGTGRSYERLAKRPINWIGLDLADSPEVAQRRRKDLAFLTFDGVKIPLEDSSVDIVYSHQVFEHVRYPERLLAEVHRVLKPSGWFVGSTSHLEPYHSRSVWNFTSYGFSVMLNDAGFHGIQFRPGIDGLTLAARRLSGGAKCLFNPFFAHESPLNIFFELSRILGVCVRRRNALKLLFSGQFTFIARTADR